MTLTLMTNTMYSRPLSAPCFSGFFEAPDGAAALGAAVLSAGLFAGFFAEAGFSAAGFAALGFACFFAGADFAFCVVSDFFPNSSSKFTSSIIAYLL